MRIVFIFLSLVLIISCKNDTKQTNLPKKNFEKIEQLQWLIGNWNNIAEEEQSYERWHQANDSTLRAHSFTIIEKDTVFAEKLTLQQTNDTAFLTAVASNQNDDQPVTFKEIFSENGVFTFENPSHDFPKRISYSNPVKDSIHAWIEGTVNGESRKVDFYFKREN